jgi:hypothetical protein
MFGSAVLDIAIGLVLVYLMLSILLTSISEAIEAIFKTRASNLEHALSQLFQGNEALLATFYRHPLIAGLYSGDYTPRPTAGTQRGSSDLPSYIPRETFAAAIMDLAERDPAAKQEMERALHSLAARVGFDPAAKRRALEAWYDSAMDRASGWFKRRTQWRLFLLGLGIALIGNVNSVTIGQYLALNQEARERIAQSAPQIAAAARQADGTNAVANETAGSEVATNEAQAANAAAAVGDTWRRTGAQLEAIGLPIGWSDPVTRLTFSGFAANPASSPASMVRWALALIILLGGYLATAFAVMLGAPFWFDILNKLMIVRSTVKPREKSPDEPPIDGPTPPPPAAAPPPDPDAEAAPDDGAAPG